MTVDPRREFEPVTRRTALGLLGAAATLPLAAPGGVAMAQTPTQTERPRIYRGEHMYEHSYQMDHGANAKGYVDAFFANLRSDEVDRRLGASLRRRGKEGKP